MVEGEIINKVANSGLITLNLEDFCDPTPREELDIAPWLFRGLILKEKDFREFVKNHPWQNYEGKYLVVNCSADAIIPTWAFMLITIHAAPLAKRVFFGSMDAFNELLYQEALAQFDVTPYQDTRIIIKGCGDIPVPVGAYVTLTQKLVPIAKSIMYGEACSNVPVYKKK